MFVMPVETWAGMHDDLPMQSITFVCECNDSDVTLSEEHDAFCWVRSTNWVSGRIERILMLRFGGIIFGRRSITKIYRGCRIELDQAAAYDFGCCKLIVCLLQSRLILKAHFVFLGFWASTLIRVCFLWNFIKLHRRLYKSRSSFCNSSLLIFLLPFFSATAIVSEKLLKPVEITELHKFSG